MPQKKRDAPSKKVQLAALLIVIVTTSTILGCREEPAAPPSASPAPPAASGDVISGGATSRGPAAVPTRSKQQAMAALMALPELQAWSHHLEKTSGGTVHGALIEYDPAPRLINGKRYFQLSFVENASAAAHRWESFLVAETGDEILVDDGATDKTLTLAQWRATKRPIERTSAQ